MGQNVSRKHENGSIKMSRDYEVKYVLKVGPKKDCEIEN